MFFILEPLWIPYLNLSSHDLFVYIPYLCHVYQTWSHPVTRIPVCNPQFSVITTYCQLCYCILFHWFRVIGVHELLPSVWSESLLVSPRIHIAETLITRSTQEDKSRLDSIYDFCYCTVYRFSHPLPTLPSFPNTPLQFPVSSPFPLPDGTIANHSTYSWEKRR